MPNELEELQERIDNLEGIIHALVFSERYIFQRDIELLDGRNMQVARGTGTKIGTAADQKLGFFGATPIIQPSLSTDTLPDALVALRALGLIL